MQLALSYGPANAGGEDWQVELAWARRVVDVLGHKHVAGELDIAPSTLTDALLERERKAIKAEWIAKLRRMAPPEMRREYLMLVCPALGYEVPQPKRALTDAEWRLEAKRLLKEKLGDLGEKLLAEIGP